ncbi:MAG: STAS domain-containing protein [Burkholderiales bacterium]
MGIEYEDIDGNFRRISLSGRLDIQGTSEIELKFTTLTAAAQRRVVVDLTAVDFLASIGIRALIGNAKALHQRQGRMVLVVAPGSSVAKSLETSGIDTFVGVFTDNDEAKKAALS